MADLPKHIAIIPDGNRRWARKKGLPTFVGHRTASEKILPALIEKAAQLGVKYLTFWAFSTENITKRTPQEVDDLFNLIRVALQKKLNQFKKKGVKLKAIGDLKKLPNDIQAGLTKAIRETKKNSQITLVLALNYGGRDEIIRAINKAQKSKIPTSSLDYRSGLRGASKIQKIDKNNFNNYLDTAGIPDPDLIIRTGGEKRLSGFMLWQSEYSELYFSDLYFPDFSPEELEKAIKEYFSRQRRHGK